MLLCDSRIMLHVSWKPNVLHIQYKNKLIDIKYSNCVGVRIIKNQDTEKEFWVTIHQDECFWLLLRYIFYSLASSIMQPGSWNGFENEENSNKWNDLTDVIKTPLSHVSPWLTTQWEQNEKPLSNQIVPFQRGLLYIVF